MASKTKNYPGYQNSTVEKYVRQIGIHIILGIGALWMLLPIYWAIGTSFNEVAITRQIIFFPENFTLENYRRAFELDTVPIFSWFMNSIIVATAVTLFNLTFDALAGYALARIDFFGREKIFLTFVATMMVPGMVTLVPMYLLIERIGLINTNLGLIIPFIANPFGIFLFRQYFKDLPESLGEAARLDGCNELQVFYHVYLPLAKPAAATLAIFVFMWTWNNFEWPLIIMQDIENYTLPVALYTARTQFTTDWTLLMAIAILLVTPILLLFVFMQRYFIRGMTLSGMKG